MGGVIEKVSCSLDEACSATGLNRSAIYRAIATGQLATFKVGKRRMVSVRAIRAFIESKEKEALGNDLRVASL